MAKKQTTRRTANKGPAAGSARKPTSTRGKAERIDEGRQGPVSSLMGRQSVDAPRSEPSQRTPARGRTSRKPESK